VALGVGFWHLVPADPPLKTAQAKAATQNAAPARVGAAAKPAEMKPAAPTFFSSQNAALLELGGMWGQALNASTPCKSAPHEGLRCYQARGALYALRQLDRPAVITLHDGSATAYGLLVALDGQNATLREQGKLSTISVADLAERFDGEFTTMWRAPQHFRDELRLGDKGADVDWLATQLAVLNQLAPPAEGTALGKATQGQLRSFQQQYQMKADGVAGPRTFMRLSQLGSADEPRLLAVAKAGK
jgi:general secretion pathway protein A